MAANFAPNDPSIPDRLRSRIEGWKDIPPKTQFQQYGPLNAYLSTKFPPSAFLVKPQALLRELWTRENMAEADLNAYRAIILGTDDDTMEIDDEVLDTVIRRASIDSQGALVQADKIHYPDFVVAAYGEEGDDNKDKIRLVIEVGSLGRDLRPASAIDKINITKQLARYIAVMGLRGVRWENKAAGMCIIGTEVAIFESNTLGKFPATTKWTSIYSEKFCDVIQSLCDM